ncbi:MAG: Transcriptional regulator, TraR/DksA family [candidate division TM6 bacterium GW2011_GWF2_28_16]|jgi:DnaK suppressor protein|nr:MAG: Transcriptional regulator, TraR/DksA family [candidate division TM6 bacterium GW2011_GWF2_28_16]
MQERAAALEKIKHKLLERRAEMMQDLDALTSQKASDGQVQDSGDEALSLTMENLQTSLEKTDIDELRLIDNALMRLEKNEYGVCMDCGEPIASKRLETFPYAARCIACQEALEG